jgi:glucose/arabinose dehydrogenase
MKIFRCQYIILLIALLSCKEDFAQNSNIQLLQAFPNLTFNQPIFLTNSNDGTNRIFVVQQNGVIKVLSNDTNVTTANIKTYLDISNKISASSGEEGLLGIAFHPNYVNNGYFYVNYTAPGPLHTVVARFKVSTGNPDKADSLSEYQILQVAQPFANHNGGNLMFGLDGYLYIGLGDGGSGGDPNNNAQNTHVLLGKVLRIDINDTTLTTRYKIPTTNPYYNDTISGRGEIFCRGMRNPWRFSQDLLTGTIYCGDVGQNIWEEIDILQAGKNYGWRVMEGYSCYNPSPNCDTTGKTIPIIVYSHTGGACSVTGGYVYRGSRRPELQGAYIYGDYCNGKIWMLRYNNGNVSSDSLLITLPTSLSSFGVDEQNELYILGYTNGKVYRFNKSSSVGINNNTNPIPEKYLLEQNYPNPFNPATKIRFRISNKIFAKADGNENVVLKVYDILGKEVATLVNAKLNDGIYEIQFSDNKLPSGIYLYKLEAGDFTDTKKMVLMK